MTKMYRDLKKHEENLKKLLATTECGVTIEDYSYGDATPVIDMACRMTRLFAERMDKLKNTITPHAGADTARKMFSGNIPLMIFDNEIGYIRVFTNLSVNDFGVEQAKECTRFTHADTILNTFITAVLEDIKDDRRKQAWVGASGRAWKRLKRTEKLPIARVLARYLNLNDWPDHKVRNLAAAIEEDLKPMQLIFADTPADFLEMYGSGPQSCMDHRHNSQWRDLIKADHTPTSFFAYWPHTRGVYVKKKGQVLGRTVLYEYVEGDWRYGRVYGNHEQDIRLFLDQLDRAGYKPIDANWKEGDRPFRFGFYRGAPQGKEYSEFEIPGIKHADSGKYMAPIPYFDNIGKDFRHVTHCEIEATFDKERKVFTFKIGPDIKGNVSTTLQTGMLFENQLSTQRCSVCDRVIQEGARSYQHQQRDRVYCRESCMKADGAVQAFRSDGIRVVVDRENTVEDPFSDGQHFYTNEDAAIANGAVVVRYALHYNEEFPEYSQHGAYIEDGKDKFRIPRNIYDHLYYVSMVKPNGIHLKQSFTQRIPTDAIQIKKQRNVMLDLNEPAFKLIGEIPMDALEKFEQAEEKKTRKKSSTVKIADDWASNDAVIINYGDPAEVANHVNVRRA